MYRNRRFAYASTCVVLLVWSSVAGAAKDALPASAPERHRIFLEECELLISKEERKAFLKTEKDYQRDAFIERFWRARDPYPETSRNEFEEAWEGRLDEVRERYGNLEEDRARMLLLNGVADNEQVLECIPLMWRTEVWEYDATAQVPRSVRLVFYFPGFPTAAHALLWRPSDGLPRLIQDPGRVAGRCQQLGYPLSSDDLEGPGRGFGATFDDVLTQCLLRVIRLDCRFFAAEYLETFTAVLQNGPQDYDRIVGRLESRPRVEQGEWLATFDAISTDLAAGSAELPATLEITFPGRDSFRTVVQGVLAVPTSEATAVDLDGRRSYDFQLTGEVLRGGELFDSFRYRFALPAAGAGETLPLVFQRPLRSATYSLVLKLEDLHGQRFFRDERELAVPRLEDPTEGIDGAVPEGSAPVARTELQLRGPRTPLLTGANRFDVVTSSDQIAKMTFALDGKVVLARRRPPWTVSLDLGSVPRTHEVAAVAEDAAGEELASAALIVNPGTQHFAVNILEPRPRKHYEGSLVARAEVATPEGQAVDRVEVYLDEALLATLYQPPWVQPISIPLGASLVYVRVVAYLEDGNSTDELVWVNAPEGLEEVDVRLVELFASVLDRDGSPVHDLPKEAFSVAEDGERQEIRRFEPVHDLPVHVAVLFDTSASMAERLLPARDAALAFFRQILTPRDRAAVITFSDHPDQVLELTSDPEVLAGQLAGIKAERGTALWDSVVSTLYQLAGIKGQRAILLLTDGKDEGSRSSYKDAVAYAQSTGVTIFSIAIDLPKREIEARWQLSHLASETGGESFFLESVDELRAAYRQIEQQLRSRYFIAYQSSHVGGSDFRAIEVQVAGGARVETLAGYFP